MTKNQPEIIAFLKAISKNEILDPSQVRLTHYYYYIENMTARLIKLENNGLYKNDLAESFTFENNKKDVFITLKDAFFSDGSKITANDVVNTIKRLILKGSPHSAPKDFIREGAKLINLEQNIEGLRIINKKTLMIGLVAPMKELLYYLQLADYGILHSTQYSKEVLKGEDWQGVVSGPYKLNSKFILKANPKSLNYHKDIPQTIIPKFYKNHQILEHLKRDKLHVGSLNFSTYVQNRKELNALKNVSMLGDTTGGVVTLTLNVNSSIFNKLQTRQWIQKKILNYFKIEKKQKDYMTKSHQFFLPDAKGHVKKAQVSDLLSHVNLNNIPSELENGFTIKTLEGMKNYLPSSFEDKLSDVLGISVKIVFDIPPSEYYNALAKRNFDAFIIASSMSYKVLGEALNLKYTSENPLWLDPHSKIHDNLKEYQLTDDIEKETNIIHNILKIMITDSECVPLFYYPKIKFYNNNLLDISEMHVEESLQFWRLRVKK